MCIKLGTTDEIITITESDTLYLIKLIGSMKCVVETLKTSFLTFDQLKPSGWCIFY
jgi:hypothetical protein